MCDRRTDIKKMRGGVFSKNIWEGAKERAKNENIIVSGPLKKGTKNTDIF